MKPGPTGQFPDGKMGEDDEGELAVGIRGENGQIIINFGAPVMWVGLFPDQAIEFANAIIQVAEKEKK